MDKKEYIEREAFREYWNKEFRHLYPNDKYLVALANFPTADVVEVRHGEWRMRGGRFRCSVCDGKALLQDVGGTGGFSHEYEQVESVYCPHCFAKMDGKGE